MNRQYVGEVTEKRLWRMVSESDAFSPNGRTKVQIIWELSVKPIDEGHCEYTNHVVAHPTDEFMAFIKKHNIKFEDPAAARQAAGGDHNRRETPLNVGAPDGAIGAKTTAAIADFEQKNGMPVNGRASQKVLEAQRR